MSRPFGAHGPSHPWLGSLGYQLGRCLKSIWPSAKFYRAQDRYARQQAASMRGKLKRGETVYLLGIGPGGHNTGIALVEASVERGMRLIFNNEEERFSGVKHDTRYPALAIEALLSQMHAQGIPVIGIPKTIDNDLGGTMMTFGFDSAVACATDALDRLHTTAESHNRIMVLEVMGRYAGWIALYSGVAGGADVILIPEIPFTYQRVCAKVSERENLGKKFTLVVVAEGAREKNNDFVTSAGPEANREARLGGIGAVVAAELEKRTGKETRSCVLGHLQRGGSPTTFDRALCSMFGATAVELIAAGDFGKMVAFVGPSVGAVNISEAVGQLKTVPTDGNLARTARALGISLGD